MAEWFYKATPSRVNFEATRALAIDDGFLCRSAFTGRMKRVANTRSVDFGDIIHVYFVGPEGARPIGSFEVVPSAVHPRGRHFPSMVQGTKLVEADEEFAERLRRLPAGRSGEPYREDPVARKFTGWLLKQLSHVMPPRYEETPLRGDRATLLRRLS